MTYEALVAFAPVFTFDRFGDERWARPGRTLYQRGAFRFLPRQDSIPLLIDHTEREIGRVHRLDVLDWTDRPWHFGAATITDPPAWLKRGTRASFQFKSYDRRDFVVREHRADVVHGAFVTEISVLSPGTEPAEPCAQVLSFRPAKRSPAAVSSSGRAATGVAFGHGEMLPPAGGRIIRYGSGQVLGVR